MHRIAIAVVLGMVCAGVATPTSARTKKPRSSSKACSAGWWIFSVAAPPKTASSSTVAVKGDRKATLNGETGQIMDLNEEKVYDLDCATRPIR